MKQLAAGVNPWRTLSSRIAYENAWIRIREDQVLRPDGQPGIYGVVEIRPSVAVVAMNDRDEVALAGQWRYPLNRWSWELPRGGSGPGEEEDLLAVAQRELREECGVEADHWEKLAALDLNNGVTTDVEHVYLARGIRHVGDEQGGDEQIHTEWVPFERALEMVLAGEITEVCSVAALLLVNRKGK